LQHRSWQRVDEGYALHDVQAIIKLSGRIDLTEITRSILGVVEASDGVGPTQIIEFMDLLLICRCSKALSPHISPRRTGFLKIILYYKTLRSSYAHSTWVHFVLSGSLLLHLKMAA
jgi:hypothetical protein